MYTICFCFYKIFKLVIPKWFPCVLSPGSAVCQVAGISYEKKIRCIRNPISERISDYLSDFM